MNTGCGGPFEPVCDVAQDAAGGLIGSFGQGAFDAALSALGKAFVSGAQSVAAVTFDALDSTTRIDLGAACTGHVAGVLSDVRSVLKLTIKQRGLAKSLSGLEAR